MTSNLPAAEGGTPVRNEFLPFARPSIGECEVAGVSETLRSGWLTVGPRTREFERAVAAYVGVARAAALHSCTAGLHLAMVAFGVGPGDEVVMPALNFAAVPNMTLHLGATPVLVDVDPSTLNVTAELIESALTDRTRVVVPVHFAGRPCPVDEILDVARARGVKVLGDAAHAIGAKLKDRMVGSIADATAFSFYVTKGITTGEGGMVTSDDAELIERIGLLSLHGMSSDAWRRYTERGSWYYEIVEPGYKYNMNDIQASLGLCQIDRIEEFQRERARIAGLYEHELSGVDGLALPPRDIDGRHAWHLYTVQIDPAALRINRDRLIRCMLEEGIGVSVHFIPVHFHPYYREYFGAGPGSFPASERYFERALSLPIYPLMTDEDALDVVRAIRKILGYYRR